MNNKTKVATGIATIILGVIAVEGGYVNDPRDPGGATMYGITEQVARANGYTGPMHLLSKDKAFDIYYDDYVVKPKYDRIEALSAPVGEKLIDAGVNVGTGRSSRWLQTALNAYNNFGKDYAQITVDGSVGQATINAYQALQARRGKKTACELIIKALDAQQLMHYFSLGGMKQYTVGWVDHRVGNVNLDRCANE